MEYIALKVSISQTKEHGKDKTRCKVRTKRTYTTCIHPMVKIRDSSLWLRNRWNTELDKAWNCLIGTQLLVNFLFTVENIYCVHNSLHYIIDYPPSDIYQTGIAPYTLQTKIQYSFHPTIVPRMCKQLASIPAPPQILPKVPVNHHSKDSIA